MEYNALMEKQAILEMAISKLDEEMKGATILDPEKVSTEVASVGTRVSFTNIETGETRFYTILGPWDADFERISSHTVPPLPGPFWGKNSMRNSR